MPVSRWWVDEPRLLGSSNPDAAEVARLRAEGFDTIVCLLDPAEQLPAYERSEVEALGFRWYGIPVGDFTAPSVEQLAAFVRLLDAQLAEGSRAVVHCQGGTGRTGTFAAAYLIARGQSAEDAIATVRGAPARSRRMRNCG
ncbi:MAG: dual specificity protein phosphatase family protein [Chloroflexi bacterium]|nr:dual specificity protein phosphatase family protein [Chloroflexota bacterium]MDA1002200.1 dual specificity protein phosphatase family protein [Chloroflexota bacterium]